MTQNRHSDHCLNGFKGTGLTQSSPWSGCLGQESLERSVNRETDILGGPASLDAKTSSQQLAKVPD